MSGTSHRTLWIVTALLIAIPAMGLLFRNALATLAATHVLARQALVCDSVQARVPFALPPIQIELAPMHCRSKAGPLQSIHFAAPLHVDLGSGHIAAVRCATATLALRAQPHREVELNTLGDLTALVGLDEPAVELMFDAAYLAERPTLPLRVANVTVLRDGRPLAMLTELQVLPLPDGLSLAARSLRAGQISALGAASLYATASPGHARAVLKYPSRLRITVIAEHLDAPKPSVRFEIAHGAGS